MIPERIKELRELCDAATPGPWEYNSDHYFVLSACGLDVCCFHDDGDPDAEFIAASRIAIPELLDEVTCLEGAVAFLKSRDRALTAARDRLQAEVEHLRADLDAIT